MFPTPIVPTTLFTEAGTAIAGSGLSPVLYLGLILSVAGALIAMFKRARH